MSEDNNERYEQMLGGGYMERRDWKGYTLPKEQHNLNMIPVVVTP